MSLIRLVSEQVQSAGSPGNTPVDVAGRKTARPNDLRHDPGPVGYPALNRVPVFRIADFFTVMVPILLRLSSRKRVFEGRGHV